MPVEHYCKTVIFCLIYCVARLGTPRSSGAQVHWRAWTPGFYANNRRSNKQQLFPAQTFLLLVHTKHTKRVRGYSIQQHNIYIIYLLIYLLTVEMRLWWCRTIYESSRTISSRSTSWQRRHSSSTSSIPTSLLRTLISPLSSLKHSTNSPSYVTQHSLINFPEIYLTNVGFYGCSLLDFKQVVYTDCSTITRLRKGSAVLALAITNKFQLK